MRNMLGAGFWGVGRAVGRLGLMLALVTVLPVWTKAADGNTPPKPAYRLGVAPYLPALTIDRLYSPIADALSFELNRLVKLRTKATLESFKTILATESYDIIFVHPFFLVEAVDRYNYVPVARLAAPLQAALAVTEDSPALALSDLVGGTIGLPPKLSAISDLLKSALADAGLRPGLDVGIRHFRNRSSCLQAIAQGSVAACGLPTLSKPPVETANAAPLRVIHETSPVHHFAFAVHERIDREDRRKLVALLLSLNDPGHEIIQAAGLPGGFVTVQPDDYAAIRARKARLPTLASR